MIISQLERLRIRCNRQDCCHGPSAGGAAPGRSQGGTLTCARRSCARTTRRIIRCDGRCAGRSPRGGRSAGALHAHPHQHCTLSAPKRPVHTPLKKKTTQERIFHRTFLFCLRAWRPGMHGPRIPDGNRTGLRVEENTWRCRRRRCRRPHQAEGRRGGAAQEDRGGFERRSLCLPFRQLLRE